MDRPTELKHLGEATPYTYLGDSHCGTIGTRLFEDPETHALIVTRIAGIWRFVASDVLSEDGMIGDQLMQALRRAGAFQSLPTLPAITGLRPVVTTYGGGRQIEQLALTQHANDRPYVITVGEINDRYLLKRLVDDDIDFDVPFEASGLDRLPGRSARTTIRSNQMINLLIEEFGALFRGLKILRAAGLRSIYLHSISPPAIDDDDSTRVLGHPSPPRLRYKLAMLANYLYERVCADIDIGFLNTWPMVTEGNLLKPEFYLDGLHLNHRHALLSVNELHRQFALLRTSLESEKLVKAE